MKVVRKSCAPGVKGVRGRVVVIDVFRAFSCAPLFFYYGARKVVLEADPERAVALKKENPHWVFVGEVNGIPIDGADMGNSPSHIMEGGISRFKGRTVVHRTTAGVTGAATALITADEVILGSFLMAEAICRYLREKKTNEVTLVAMGDRASKKAPEDEACADYMEHLLTNTPWDPVESFQRVVFQKTAQKFITGEKTYLPPEDPAFCLQKDLFDFVLRAEKRGDLLRVMKVGG